MDDLEKVKDIFNNIKEINVIEFNDEFIELQVNNNHLIISANCAQNYGFFNFTVSKI